MLEAAIAEGQLALEHTTEMNPVLKKAGVVDAGGKGFLVILQGMLDSLRGVPMPEGDGEGEAKVESKTDYAAIAAEEITFTFDTVFIVRKTSPHKGLEAFEAYLNSIGDSLVIGEDDEAFKVHVHTDIPGQALTEAAKYGTLELAKIENMRTQAEDLAAGRHIQSTDDLDAVEAELEGNHGARKIAPPEKKYGVVAVAAGDGLAAVFRDLGADGVISGGQTMNPSTDDILREIDATPAEVVFVLPNNKNIIMAAEQCVRLVEGKQVVVLPTKTIPQGISALMVMDPEAEVEDNRAAMAEAIGRVHTSEITYAARDSDFDGFAIKRGDYLALTEHQLFGTDRKQCVANILGIHLQLSDYGGQVFVSLLMVPILALLYKGLKRVIPANVQMVFVPFICFVVMIPLTAFLIGPLSIWLGNGMGSGLAWLNTNAPVVFAVFIPLLYPFLVPLGLH